MSRYHLFIVTFALMMGLFLASLEVTVVSTVMPTVVGELRGLEIYSWVFSIYMLTSTTTVPLFGRLSDLYGRKPIYMFGIFFFLLGSALSGQAGSMTALVAFRAIQGLGAGALLPMAFTIIGDIYTLEQRARMQGLFSGVWGISSLVGPLVGGFLVDYYSWRWAFYLNLPFGLIAAVLIGYFLQEPVEERGESRIDVWGAVLLMLSVLSLLYAMLQGGTGYAWSDPRLLGLLSFSFLAFVAFIIVERRVADPLLPLNMYQDRLFAVASAHSLVSGLAIFGMVAFIPLFVQGVLGTNATQAGASLTPMTLGWVSGSIVSGYLLLRVGPRWIAMAAMASMVTGAFLVTRLGTESSHIAVLISMLLMGLGMGTTITSFTVAVQTRVSRRRLGIATSALQFMRQIGATVGVSLLGAVMAARLAAGLERLPGAENIDPQSLLHRSTDSGLPQQLTESFQVLLADALHPAFYITLAATVIGFLVVTLTPRGTTQQLVAEGDRAEQPVAARGASD